jgi:hypothetical protein
MSPKKALQLYMAIKRHFTSESYDVFDFVNRTKPLVRKNENIDKRKDKIFIVKLSKHPDPAGLLISNLSVTPSLWLGQIFETEAIDRYHEWRKFQDAKTYLIREQIKQLRVESFTSLPHQHPEVLKLYFRKKLSLDTLVILDDFFKFTQYWNDDDDPAMKQTKFVMKKYRPFIPYDREKLRKIIDIIGLRPL